MELWSNEQLAGTFCSLRESNGQKEDEWKPKASRWLLRTPVALCGGGGGGGFCLCGGVHKSAAAQGGQERASDPMELEVEMSVRCLN